MVSNQVEYKSPVSLLSAVAWLLFLNLGLLMEFAKLGRQHYFAYSKTCFWTQYGCLFAFPYSFKVPNSPGLKKPIHLLVQDFGSTKPGQGIRLTLFVSSQKLGSWHSLSTQGVCIRLTPLEEQEWKIQERVWHTKSSHKARIEVYSMCSEYNFSGYPGSKFVKSILWCQMASQWKWKYTPRNCRIRDSSRPPSGRSGWVYVPTDQEGFRSYDCLWFKWRYVDRPHPVRCSCILVVPRHAEKHPILFENHLRSFISSLAPSDILPPNILWFVPLYRSSGRFKHTQIPLISYHYHSVLRPVSMKIRGERKEFYYFAVPVMFDMPGNSFTTVLKRELLPVRSCVAKDLHFYGNRPAGTISVIEKWYSDKDHASMGEQFGMCYKDLHYPKFTPESKVCVCWDVWEYNNHAVLYAPTSFVYDRFYFTLCGDMVSLLKLTLNLPGKVYLPRWRNTLLHAVRLIHSMTKGSLWYWLLHAIEAKRITD